MSTVNNTATSNTTNVQNSVTTNTVETSAPATGELTHESTLYAEPIAQIGSFTVTNALFTSWVVVFLLIVIGIVVKTSIKKYRKEFRIYLNY